MKKWRVGICYSGYVWREVEAESEDDAWRKAQEEPAADKLQLTDLSRWKDADQVEEA
jgi:hypothetical protein